MLAGVGLEQFAEVGAARAEDDFVRGKGASITGEGHIDKVLFVAQVAERGENGRLEVVPLEGVLLLGRRWGHGWLHLAAAGIIIVIVTVLRCRMQ